MSMGFHRKNNPNMPENPKGEEGIRENFEKILHFHKNLYTPPRVSKKSNLCTHSSTG